MTPPRGYAPLSKRPAAHGGTRRARYRAFRFSVLPSGASAPVREYVLSQQAEALEALLVTANAGATPVQRLRRAGWDGGLERGGVGVTGRAGASQSGAHPSSGGFRRVARRAERPHAPWLRHRHLPRPGGPHVQTAGRTGAQRLPASRRAGSLEPWTWLALAWLAGRDGEPALRRSLAASPRAHHPRRQTRPTLRAAAVGLAARAARPRREAQAAATEACGWRGWL